LRKRLALLKKNVHSQNSLFLAFSTYLLNAIFRLESIQSTVNQTKLIDISKGLNPMNLSEWFFEHLRASADGFVWGVQQVPEARRNLQPPGPLGEWTAARHVFHMVFYEQQVAIPSMHQWLGKPCPQEGEDEDTAWGQGNVDVDSLLGEFKKVRAEQVRLLASFDDLAWQSTRETIWGPVPLAWVVTKTYQHTAEHTSNVLRIALWWDAWMS
jgi:hypothetical protein